MKGSTSMEDTDAQEEMGGFKSPVSTTELKLVV